MTPAERYASAKVQGENAHRKPLENRVWVCKLREIRDRVGLTLDDVAEALDLTRSLVHRLEHGHETTLAHARRVAAFFGVTVEEMWPQMANQPKE